MTASTSGAHLTGKGRRGAPELPLVKALGALTGTPGALNGPSRPPLRRAGQRWLGTARLVSSAPGLATVVSVSETGGELVAVRDQLSLT